MSFRLASAKLTGNPDSSGWAQVHEFKPENPEKLKNRGHLFAVIATQGASVNLNNVVLGREILSRLHEEYFGNQAKDAFNCLKGSLERVSSEFSSLLGNIEIGAVTFIEKVVYVGAVGGAQISLFREGMFARILVSRKDKVVGQEELSWLLKSLRMC